MHEGEGSLRAMIREIVESEGVEVPRSSWPAKPPKTAAALLKMWKWKRRWWVDLVDIGFYGPYPSLSRSLKEIDLEGLSPPDYNASDVDDFFQEAFNDELGRKSKGVFTHSQSRNGCGSAEWVSKWGKDYWADSLDHGLSGPYDDLVSALSDAALFVSDATSSVSCKEMSAEELVELLVTRSSTISRPFDINDIPYHVVDGKIVPYVENDDDA